MFLLMLTDYSMKPFWNTCQLYLVTVICKYLVMSTYNWENYQGHTEFSSHFCDRIFELNLKQVVNKPTHISGNILDIVLTKFSINQSEFNSHGLSSDHFIINCSISTPFHTAEQKASYTAYNYSKTN